MRGKGSASSLPPDHALPYTPASQLLTLSDLRLCCKAVDSPGHASRCALLPSAMPARGVGATAARRARGQMWQGEGECLQLCSCGLPRRSCCSVNVPESLDGGPIHT